MYRCIGILLCLFSMGSYAAISIDENTILRTTIINNTNDTLHFAYVAEKNPGNLISVDPININPGATGVVTVEKTLFNDVYTRLIFNTQKNIDVALLLLVQEQIHFGQPVFNIISPQYKSVLLSKTRNPNIGPRFLTYIAAAIELTERECKRASGG